MAPRGLRRPLLCALLAAGAVASSLGGIPRASARPRAGEPRPSATLLACSPRRPVCVHGVSGRIDVAHALAAAEAALATFDALGLPPPLGDGLVGGSPALDLYVTGAVERGEARLEATDPVAVVDTGASFALVPPPSPGCRFEHEVARATGETVVLGLDAATGPALLRMYGSYLAAVAVPCLHAELPEVAERAEFPERGLFGAEPDSTFLQYLAEAYGGGDPLAVPLGLLAASPQRATPSAPFATDEPDPIDALRTALRSRGGDIDDVLLDHAVARAFMGSRSDGVHLTDSERFGDAARVRFEWAVPLATLPRRLGPRDPLQDSGASYLWIDLGTAEPHGSLETFFEWDEGQVFRWAVVKVDAAGQEMGRLTVPAVYGRDSARLSVADFEGAAGLLVVGVHVGSDDRVAPLDPDDPPGPGAGYFATFFRPSP